MWDFLPRAVREGLTFELRPEWEKMNHTETSRNNTSSTKALRWEFILCDWETERRLVRLKSRDPGGTGIRWGQIRIRSLDFVSWDTIRWYEENSKILFQVQGDHSGCYVEHTSQVDQPGGWSAVQEEMMVTEVEMEEVTFERGKRIVLRISKYRIATIVIALILLIWEIIIQTKFY